MIIIVSGLPRSGTSMMMQMLQAGGIKILTDQKRKPDINNPKGYLEFEKTKDLQNDFSWMDLAEGKAVKIVSPLLASLPARDDYKIIFMERDLNEIIASQKKMAPTKENDQQLLVAFEKHLKEIKDYLKNKRVLFVDHRQVIKNPKRIAEKVSDFLATELNLNAMAKVVDPKLYRQRTVFIDGQTKKELN
ncbi:MAG: sulfotransferase domain-containing protein [Patescibacteria group bacterium]